MLELAGAGGGLREMGESKERWGMSVFLNILNTGRGRTSVCTEKSTTGCSVYLFLNIFY